MKALDQIDQSLRQEQAKLAIDIVAGEGQLKLMKERFKELAMGLNTCAEARKQQTALDLKEPEKDKE